MMMKKTDMPCGCCEAAEAVTPRPMAQRPGLSHLRYRAGDHAAFLESMLARLSDGRYPALRRLTTRSPGDPAIALLDAWALVADVLTFYDERIANEGYLRTATERRSVVELARLVGYAPRPGVAASIFLAYTIEPTFKGEAVIALGTRSQSVPGPGELPQTFETAAVLKARASWNNLQPRRTQPQSERSIRCGRGDGLARVYIKGLTANLRPHDAIEIDFPDSKLNGPRPEFYRLRKADLDPMAGITTALLRRWDQTDEPIKPVQLEVLPGALARNKQTTFDDIGRDPSQQPVSPQRLDRSVGRLFAADTDVAHRLLAVMAPAAGSRLQTAVSNAQVTPDNLITCRIYRGKAGLFGANHPGKIKFNYTDDQGNGSDKVQSTVFTPLTITEAWGAYGTGDKLIDTLVLDGDFSQIKERDKVLISLPELHFEEKKRLAGGVLSTQVNSVESVNLPVFGQVGKTTVLTCDKFLVDKFGEYAGVLQNPKNLTAQSEYLRGTTVYILPEELELAEEPLTAPVCKGASTEIELDSLRSDLVPGRWLIVSGERTDVLDAIGKPIPGILDAEVVMLAAVTQEIKQVPGMDDKLQDLPGDRVHTFIRLANDLAYCYKRDTVTIYGNVAKATHGETRPEVLGSGNAAASLLTFTLKQPPLTFVAASTPAGTASTLKVYVNDVEWREAESLVDQGPADHAYVTKTGDDGKSAVSFGTGVQGARPPTGVENVRAVYRNGIGKPGNVKAGQVTTAMDRPQGLKDVINPVAASGGADPDDRDTARSNVPLATAALDRLVAVRDYADFARAFAGIGKAAAVKVPNGRRPVVHLTIAGTDDIPIATTSDLYRSLRRSLLDYGDPFVAVQVASRDLRLPVLSAGIGLQPGYLWEAVERALRAVVLGTFGFRQRSLGQDLVLGEVLTVMQDVPGVAYVDVDTLDALSQADVLAAITALTPGGGASLAEKLNAGRRERIPLRPAHFDPEQNAIMPAQLAYFSPDVPETLILNLLEVRP
jgi:hypothetical protein